ncbi:MAG: hypothetical protein MZV65_02060 [Chromatiales bacterium]|nr:hypothetical protein [Chromatiales bacterium]
MAEKFNAQHRPGRTCWRLSTSNGDFPVYLQQTLSAISDLDYAEATIRLSVEATTLYAAQ